MDSTEKLTRVLRGKSNDVDELLGLGSDVLHGVVSVSLPHRHMVLLEWLLDRMRKSEVWRHNTRAWNFLREVWLDADAEVRRSILRRFSFLKTILLPTLEFVRQDSSDLVSSELLQAIAESLSLILVDGEALVDSGSDSLLYITLECSIIKGQKFNTLLSALFPILEGLIRSRHMEESTPDISVLKQADQGQMTKRELYAASNKERRKQIKSTTYLLALSMALLSLPQGTGLSIDISLLILSKIFTPLSSLDQYGKKSVISIRLAIHEASAFCPETDIIQKSVPRVFSFILSGRHYPSLYLRDLIGKWPQMTNQLLQQMVDAPIKTKLDPEIAQQIFVAELVKKEPDWARLTLTLKLHAKAVSVNLQELLILINRTDASGQMITELVLTLTQSYSNLNILPKFFVTWCRILGNSSSNVWLEDSFVHLFSSHLSLLSAHQIRVLFNECQRQCTPLLVLVRAISRWSPERLVKMTDVLVDLLLADISGPDYLVWSVRYALLMLHVDVVTSASTEFIAKWACVETVPCAPRTFCFFRVYEVFPKLFSLEDRVNNLDTFSSEELDHVSQRWLYFVDSYFPDELLTKLCELYCKNTVSLTYISSADLLHSLPTFTSRLLKVTLELSTSEAFAVLWKFPLNFLDKGQKNHLLSVTIQRLRKGSSQLSELQCLEQLLTTCDIGRGPLEDIELIECMFEATKKAGREPQCYLAVVIARILKGSHGRFLKASRKHLMKRLKKMGDKLKSKYLSIIKLACLLLAADPNHTEFRDCVLLSVKKAITSSNTELFDIAAILHFAQQSFRELPSNHLAQEWMNLLGDLCVKSKSRLQNEDVSFFNLSLFGCLSALYRQETMTVETVLSLTAQYMQIYYAMSLGDRATASEILETVVRSTESATQYVTCQQVVSLCFSSDNALSAAAFHILNQFGAMIVPYGETEVESTQLLSQFLVMSVGACGQWLPSVSESVAEFMIKIVRHRTRPILSRSNLELIITLAQQIVMSEKCVETTFCKVCDLLSALLASDRLRVAKSYHLFMSVMKTLMIKLAKKFQTSTCASKLARVIIALCNPSVASLSKRTTGWQTSSLVPVQQKHKQLLSKHITEVLDTYADVELKISLSPEVRACLLPAIHAVFDVIGNSKALKAASVLMAPSSRAVAQNLYNDYVRNGQWVEE